MHRLHVIGMTLFLAFFYSLIWLALWTISFYLSNNGQQAALLLPQGLRLALMILLPRKYWPTLLLAEIAIQSWLISEQLITRSLLLLSPFLSLIPAIITHKIWHRYTLYWQRLLLLLAALTLNTVLHGIAIGPWLHSQLTQTLLATFTGGVLLIPFTYLLYEYIKQQHLQTLLAQEIPDPPLRTSLLIWCSLFFSIGVCLQMTFTPEMERLLLIFVFLPNVVMAYKFGWQGGVLSAVLGSLMIAVTRQVSGAFDDLRELELFLSTQALLGIGLGIAISRQQQLAQRLQRYRHQLEQELKTRRRLMERIIHTEEAVRKDIARELHDDIGQNITAIQIQAMLVKHSAPADAAQHAAGQISELSRRIHHTTRQLLRQLRPPVLDEMVLDKALHHLADEFAFSARGIQFQLDYQLPTPPHDDVVVFTLYRLVQELLNNINKHASATQITVRLSQQDDLITLDVIDNGVGIAQKDRSHPTGGGFGLRGIEERVQALGGNWLVKAATMSDSATPRGTHIIVNLPTKFKQKDD
ncbi:MASE1 domain-containing protein [Pectobacterium brasiliense]|uniref:Oxygen sensor histidine kinase NreB n=3 Tax=Pectobacterium brasiliense TaxID=180957 RepID=A0A433NH28_9GAMM|nr:MULTISPECIES: MASE1 domain-containing protein [Pectobacterium]GKW26827.1 sensor histidine kinase [Pectobacterium carotovorum subsp. carotovorum]MBN3047892.1 MASE1 domain-containing protein [Pectobacterium brasiliense]MBN3076622.1 MASE1 domain-containing protein [Pectobacterium brasiliense]MBN3084098.1 MASE1 domain-containing protein [Pectobacterium brasiliense]MBN3088361.1 MASE1 domain-containing protein [Pectobacterium brasiliense]